MRILWLAAALVSISACALMRRPSEGEKCLWLDAQCRTSDDCCSMFCANGECAENPYTGE